MPKLFSSVKRPRIKTSNFNLSEEHKLSCNFGEIIPILCKEMIPSDRFEISTELLIKFAPLKAPVMHRVKAKVDYFFVPNFQVTDLFSDFINPKVNTAANPIVLPHTSPNALSSSLSGNLVSSLADYLGLPVTQSTYWAAGFNAATLSVLPFMCYQHIYNSYFRDQNMEVLEGADPLTTSLFLVDNFRKTSRFSTVIGANQLRNLFTLRRSAWKKDYFTSALPSPQAGDDVELAFSGGTAPVYLDKDNMPFGDHRTQNINDDQGSELAGPGTLAYQGNNGHLTALDSDGDPSTAYLDPNNTLFVDVPGGSITINNLRRLFVLQHFKELAERGGTRYPEVVRNFFGAYLPDWYFDRPIYLGGQVQPVQIGEVVQTTSDTSNPLAYRGGIANSYGRTRTVRFKAPCHGFVIGVLRILPEATYSQGVERMWTRESIYDYAFPQFAHLGEQEILNREIFADGSADDKNIFGYTPRYAEYKTGHTHIAGKFRTDLDYWHFGRTFANRPLLNKSFIMMDSMDYDPFYTTTAATEHVYVDLYNNILARRPLPYYGTPGLLKL